MVALLTLHFLFLAIGGQSNFLLGAHGQVIGSQPYEFKDVSYSPGASTVPFSFCQGNCDVDSDCEGTLECWKRPDVNSPGPPGCFGQMTPGWDYCYSQVYDGTYTPVSLNPAVPLGHCQGDCDNDSDCDANLKCFNRDTSKDPGPSNCAGIMTEDWDYCYNPDPMVVGTFRAPFIDPSFRLGICVGDCDNDSECGVGLKCWQRENADEPGPPGCRGSMVENWDYCYDPNKNIIQPPGPGKFHVSRGWRLKAIPQSLESAGQWKIDKIQFFSSIDCSGAPTVTDGTPIASGYYKDWHMKYAFQDTNFQVWIPPNNEFSYIGMLFSAPQEVGCIKVTNGSNLPAREVTIQAYDSESRLWKNFRQNNLNTFPGAVTTILCVACVRPSRPPVSFPSAPPSISMPTSTSPKESSPPVSFPSAPSFFTGPKEPTPASTSPPGVDTETDGLGGNSSSSNIALFAGVVVGIFAFTGVLFMFLKKKLARSQNEDDGDNKEEDIVFPIPVVPGGKQTESEALNNLVPVPVAVPLPTTATNPMPTAPSP